MRLQKNNIRPFHLFLALSLVCLILFALMLPWLGQKGMDWVVMENNSDFEAADYTLCQLFALCGDEVYHCGVDACYSPLAYGFFALFNKIGGLDRLLADVDVAGLSYQEMIALTGDILAMPYQILTYLMYILFGVLLYLLAVDTLDIGKTGKRLLALTIVCSVPLLFGAAERGNLTLYVAAMALLAFRWRDDESPVKRELALLLIAAAAGLKFYPAFLGLLYLQEKRWKEAARLIVYGALFVFVPFAVYGGVDGLLSLLKNLSQLSASTSYSHRIQFFQGLVTFVLPQKAGKLLSPFFLLALFVLFFGSRNRVRRATYLAAMLALFPPNSYRYMLLFFLLPLFAWIEDQGSSKSKGEYVTAVLFGLVFSVPVFFGILTGFRLNFGYYALTYVEVFVYLAAWALLGYQVIRGLIQWRNERKMYRANAV